jgi:hypothetical protein
MSPDSNFSKENAATHIDSFIAAATGRSLESCQGLPKFALTLPSESDYYVIIDSFIIKSRMGSFNFK